MPDDARRQAVCRRVAALLREERERQGLSMTEVAARAGLSQQMVSYVERGMRQPTLDTLLRLAGALEVDLAKTIAMATCEEASPPVLRHRGFAP